MGRGRKSRAKLRPTARVNTRAAVKNSDDAGRSSSRESARRGEIARESKKVMRYDVVAFARARARPTTRRYDKATRRDATRRNATETFPSLCKRAATPRRESKWDNEILFFGRLQVGRALVGI